MLKLFYTVIAVVVLAVLLVVFYASSIITTAIEKVGSEAVGAPVKVASVDISFLTGEGHIKNLTVANPQGYSENNAFELGEVYLKLDPQSIFTPKVHIEEVRVSAPKIRYEGDLKGSNFKQIQKNVESFAGSSDKAVGSSTQAEQHQETADHTEGKKLQLDLFVMEKAEVDVAMNIAGQSQNAGVNLPKIEVKNIGKEGEGASAAEVVNKVISPVIKAVVGASSKVVMDVQGQMDKAKDSVKEKASGFMNKLLGN